MTRIAPVNLNLNPKTLWFDARDLELSAHDAVVVLTARGLELGTMAGEVFEATEDDMRKLNSSLKPVKRIATEEDIAQGKEMERLGAEALPIFRTIAADTNADMRPISVEYLLEGDKAVFYFEAEDRVDFRELVRILASRFHVRVDMRQIGVREEARMVGGYGHCGQPLCCCRMGGEFNPVSIRMAKEQDLSLNPQKISGVCVRLMCCLRYEYDAYKDFKQRAPKVNATISTPEGPAKVASLDVPREIVVLRVGEDNKTVKVPLADMDAPEGDARPNSVGQSAWDAVTAPVMNEELISSFLTSQLTGTDKLGEAKAVRRNNANVKNATGSTPVGASKKSESSRKRRRRGGGGGAASDQVQVEATHRQRRRRSTTLGADGSAEQVQGAEAEKQPAKKEAAEPKKQGTSRRRRRGGSGKQHGEGAAASKSAQQGKQKNEQQAPKDRPASPRPGQKSSGLRAGAQGQQQESAGGEGKSSSGGRRRRRSRSKQGGQQKGATDEA
ncbi:MAG: regulatory iron-sulfur-containing complex subunit RicT [Coriobacteriia bacterium]|nr:regulatory iron-sulfur-containing complex subunit RicT [Coriobacteriia bacterium]